MIKIQNLSFAYNRLPVFSDIDLEFSKGCIYGLLGENGVGKTTLLKLISGLLRPQQGTCQVNGFSSQDRLPEMLSDMFFLPDAVVLPVGRTPMQYVQGLRPFYPRFSQQRLDEMMRLLEVDATRRFSEMSYGQQKKCLIACAMSMGTRYLLLDEPTNGLDIPSKSQFRSLLSHQISDDSTILISTHQVKDVENLIDPIVILSRQGVLMNASIEAISHKLLFEYGVERHPEALFSEILPGGWLNVLVNTTGEETPVNIEALFNTVHQNPVTINELFKTK
ncbi:MAG: ABC transporter ATP-binding protein [Prevotella sp.]|nr:ABC transporter ATP-binding protein [Prevotella sp.]